MPVGGDRRKCQLNPINLYNITTNCVALKWFWLPSFFKSFVWCELDWKNWHIRTTSETGFVKFYPKGRLTWWYFVVFFDLESWCYSAEVGVASLFCKSPFAFLDKQDARIVALYRGVSQKVGFGSTALLNLQKLVGSVQSERCKRCFAKSLKSATVWKCSFVHSHLCSFLGFDWNAPMLAGATWKFSTFPGQALHWIYGVPQDSNEVSTSVGINKKKAKGCQRCWWRRAYIVILLLFPSSI